MPVFSPSRQTPCWGWGGVSYKIAPPDILLPVGISFFTFQSMGYVIDCYRGHTRREQSFVRFAAFVSLFPQLVAGPIERSGNLLSQFAFCLRLRSPTSPTGSPCLSSACLRKWRSPITWLSSSTPSTRPRTAIPAAPGDGHLRLRLANLLRFQRIYRYGAGVARMMGLRLMLNFDHPYLATGLGDFWSRWHISLSTWFRDYVYVPLGGNRIGSYLTYRNLFDDAHLRTLARRELDLRRLGGHPRDGLCDDARCRTLRMVQTPRPRVHQAAGRILFRLFYVDFLPCRQHGRRVAHHHQNRPRRWGDPGFPILAVALVASLWVYEVVCESQARDLFARPVFRVSAVAGMILYLCTIPGSGDVPFIYFQF